MPHGPKAAAALLDELTAAPGVEGAAVVRRDGVLVAHRLAGGLAPETLAAMAGVLAGGADLVFDPHGRAPAAFLLVESADRRLLVVPAGDHLVVAVAKRGAPFDDARAAAERAAAALGRALASSEAS